MAMTGDRVTNAASGEDFEARAKASAPRGEAA
jgi:hypothetical protein